MAVTMEGFSIREYASRMRSIDVVKCWPFDEANEEVVRTILPSITIKKFSWWFDELRLVQDDEEVTDLESESLQFMRMKRVQKGKSRAKAKAKSPKKRSIVELFAVAPQVERVNSDDDEDNGEFSDDERDSKDGTDGEDGIPNPKFSSFRNVGFNCKSKRKVKKKGILSMLKKEKIVMIKDLKKRKEKKKEKIKKMAVDLRITKKDKTSKLKLQTSADIVKNSNCAIYRKDLFDAIVNHSKKPRLKRFTTERMKCKVSSISKFLPHDEQAVFPVRGILKNQKKIVPAENSLNSILDASKLSNTQHVNKHVTFLGKDDVLDPRKNTCPAVELELRSFCNLFSDVGDASLVKGHNTEMEKTVSMQEMKKTGEERSRCTEDGVEVLQETEKQFSSRHHVSDAPNFVFRQHGLSQVNKFSTTVPFCQGPLHNESPLWFEGHNRVASHDALYTCSSDIPSMSREHYIPKLTIPMFSYSSDASISSRRFLDISGDAGPELDSDCSMDFLKAYPRPPSSCLSMLPNNANSRPIFPPQNMRENNSEHALSYQWFPHLSPKELMRTICSLPSWNSGVSICGETSMNEDFIGLPLNSQGQFITVNSSGKDGFNHISSTSAVAGPSWSPPMHNNVFSNPMVNQIGVRSWNDTTPCRNQHKTFKFKDSSGEIEHSALSSRIGMIEQYGIRRRNTAMQGSDPYFYAMKSDMDRMKVSHIECRPDYQVQEHPGDEIIQQHGNADQISLHVTRSTMRLMGQEFTIGGRDLEGREDREVWTDKPIIAEHCGGSATKSSSVKSQDFPRFVVHPILGKLKETVTDFSKGKTIQASERVPQMMVSEPKSSSQLFDCYNNVMPQNDDRISKGFLLPEIYPQFSLGQNVSHKSTLQESFSCSPLESSQISVPASTLLDPSRNLSRSSTQPEHKHTPVNGSQFAFKFPFSDSECGRHTHPSWAQNSFKVVPPYFFETRPKETLIDHRQPYYGPGNICNPFTMSGTNYGTDASVFSRPEPFHLSPCSSSPNAFTSASLAHHPSFPLHPGFLPNCSTQNRRGEKIKFDNQLKSRFSVRIPTRGKISKKRLPTASNGSKKSSKIPKIGVREDCSCTVTEVETGNKFEGDVQCSKEVYGPASAEYNTDSVGCGQTGIHKDELRDFTGMDSYKLEGTPRSGPVKLTAGTRYILKPCLKNDQAISKPTDSTIPVVASTCDRKVFGYEKSSEVYRF